jgi:hypothetical protein
MLFADLTNASKITSVVDSGIIYYVAMGDNGIVAGTGLNFSNISSTTYSVDAADWDYCNENQIPIFNNPAWYPEYWMPIAGAQKLQPLMFSDTDTWQAAGKSANIIRSHKNFLFALGTVESGIELPTTFRWSAPADTGGVPFTWDETDLSTIAGTAVLTGNYGRIVDGLTLRDSFVIYSDGGTNILNYVGGEFIWNVTEFSSTSGILAKNCVVCAEQKHYVITQDDIIVHDGTNLSSLLYNRFRNRVRAALASTHAKNSYVLADHSKKEIWFCIVEATFTYPNLLVIYNWSDDTLALRDIGDKFAGISYSPLIASSVLNGWEDSMALYSSLTKKYNELANVTSNSYENITMLYSNTDKTWSEMMGNAVGQEPGWDDQPGSWDVNPFHWNYTNDIPILDAIIGINPTTGVVSALTVNDFKDDFNTVVIREDVVFDNLLSVSSIVSMYPIIQCEGQMEIQIGSKYFQGESTQWQPAVIYSPGLSKKVDIRTTGVYHSWKFSSIGNTPFTLSGFTVYYANNGKR